MISINSILTHLPDTGKVQTGEKVDENILKKAQEFEAVFVGQMLTHSGFADAFKGSDDFGGGAFTSILLDQYAEKIVANGGFGLADQIYNQLIDEKKNATNFNTSRNA